jgi:hypothetical protein
VTNVQSNSVEKNELDQLTSQAEAVLTETHAGSGDPQLEGFLSMRAVSATSESLSEKYPAWHEWIQR